MCDRPACFFSSKLVVLLQALQQCFARHKCATRERRMSLSLIRKRALSATMEFPHSFLQYASHPCSMYEATPHAHMSYILVEFCSKYFPAGQGPGLRLRLQQLGQPPSSEGRGLQSLLRKQTHSWGFKE